MTGLDHPDLLHSCVQVLLHHRSMEPHHLVGALRARGWGVEWEHVMALLRSRPDVFTVTAGGYRLQHHIRSDRDVPTSQAAQQSRMQRPTPTHISPPLAPGQPPRTPHAGPSTMPPQMRSGAHVATRPAAPRPTTEPDAPKGGPAPHAPSATRSQAPVTATPQADPGPRLVESRPVTRQEHAPIVQDTNSAVLTDQELVDEVDEETISPAPIDRTASAADHSSPPRLIPHLPALRLLPPEALLENSIDTQPKTPQPPPGMDEPPASPPTTAAPSARKERRRQQPEYPFVHPLHPLVRLLNQGWWASVEFSLDKQWFSPDASSPSAAQHHRGLVIQVRKVHDENFSWLMAWTEATHLDGSSATSWSRWSINQLAGWTPDQATEPPDEQSVSCIHAAHAQMMAGLILQAFQQDPATYHRLRVSPVAADPEQVHTSVRGYLTGMKRAVSAGEFIACTECGQALQRWEDVALRTHAHCWSAVNKYAPAAWRYTRPEWAGAITRDEWQRSLTARLEPPTKRLISIKPRLPMQRSSASPSQIPLRKPGKKSD